MNCLDNVLITGCAGFIGAALTEKFLINGINVVGIDNLNSYYDLDLKKARLRNIEENSNNKRLFSFYQVDLEDKLKLEEIFQIHKISIVVHLAAQAGVRYSIEKPNIYFQSNLMGFGNILEVVRRNNISNFIFASSSSVYGANKKIPFEETDKVDNPVSLYAATKKANEIMAFSYSHLYKIPTTGLRFFTVYGPWGRPDMAPMLFTKSILENTKIKVFNNGLMRRDFTYIDDITEGIFKCCFKIPNSKINDINSAASAPYRIFNIGNGKPIELMDFIKILERNLGIPSNKEFTDMQKGDVVETYADTNALKKWVGYNPTTDIEEGVEKFVKWYRDFYK